MVQRGPDELIRRYTTIAATIDILHAGELPLLNPETWDDRNDRHFMALYKGSKAKQGIKSVYALCAATCPETYHHWRVFTAAADGACIEIRRAPLEAALRRQPTIRFGEIEYLKLDEADELTPDDLTRLPFIKRQAFEPEQEYRIVLESDKPQGPAFSIELPRAWIGRVVLNPWLPRPLAESVIVALKAIGGQDLTVQRSLLIDSPRWKRAGDRVAGVRAPKRHVLKLVPEADAPSKPVKPKKPAKPKAVSTSANPVKPAPIAKPVKFKSPAKLLLKTKGKTLTEVG